MTSACFLSTSSQFPHCSYCSEHLVCIEVFVDYEQLSKSLLNLEHTSANISFLIAIPLHLFHHADHHVQGYSYSAVLERSTCVMRFNIIQHPQVHNPEQYSLP
ncbi:hypothetical protein BDR05DRAFT_967550, partial [Suillus weaverae]